LFLELVVLRRSGKRRGRNLAEVRAVLLLDADPSASDVTSPQTSIQLMGSWKALLIHYKIAVLATRIYSNAIEKLDITKDHTFPVVWSALEDWIDELLP
jgi:hypothetical protein